jgi:hypothetical protein
MRRTNEWCSTLSRDCKGVGAKSSDATSVTTVTNRRARRAAERLARRTSAGPLSEEQEEEGPSITQPAPVRPRRNRQPSVRLNPKEWVLK